MEEEIRLAAFAWLKEELPRNGGTLPRALLARGFLFRGEYVTLVGASGIWKPRQIGTIPISITSTVSGPYDDAFSDDGLLIYRYRGTNPAHRDNIGLHEAMESRTPLIYFHGIVPGRYNAVWPVSIVETNPAELYCLAAVDPAYALQGDIAFPYDLNEARNLESVVSIRRYVVSVTKRRLHQSSFREHVIAAYDSHCSLCSLAHRELLDAAHIIPDSDEMGDPIVQNGVSLCKIHHAAFDQNILGITPDYEIRLRNDILEEIDGPMLRHGLQELHGAKLHLPKRRSNWPDRDRLDIRYSRFLHAS